MRRSTLFLFLALSVSALRLAAAPILRNPQPIALGSDPVTAIKAADFNGDGHDDLLLASSTHSLTVYLDNGTGPFAAPVTTPITATFDRPGITVGDVNGDGRQDVVLVDVPSQSIVVMYGNGDGTFTLGATIPTPLGLVLGVLAVGDFNGDHFADIALGTMDPHSVSNFVTVYNGDGAGHFSAGATITLQYEAGSLVPVDMNNDGRTDLIVSAAYIYLGNADGTFTLEGSMPTGGVSISVGDFDHDGKQDVLAGLDLYRGNGDGTVTKSATITCGADAFETVAADIDGDGKLDAVGISQGFVLVARGNGDGTFQTPQLFAGDQDFLTGFAVSDFDRDGKADLVHLGAFPDTGRPVLSFVRGNGDGTLQLYRGTWTGNVTTPYNSAVIALTADVNNDGKPDSIVLQPHSDNLNDNYEIAVLLNDGAGKLNPPIHNSTTMQWFNNTNIALADVNHDGKIDVVLLTSWPSVAGQTLLGNGDGTFGTPIPFSASLFGDISVADFDGDGIPDLLVVNSSQFTLQHGNGDGTFAPPVTSNATFGTLLTGDLNGDGKLDFVIGTFSGASVWINDGSGHFTVHAGTNDQMWVVALADLNGDGKLDMISSGLQVRLGNGDGTFGPWTFMTMSPAPAIEAGPVPPVAIGDFDGDGKLDVAVQTAIYLGNGDGTFRSRAQSRAIAGSSQAAADIDGNGSADLVYLANERVVSVIRTKTTPDPTLQSSIALSVTPSPAQYGHSVTFTAKVTGSSIPLTGVVRFSMNGTPFALVDPDSGGTAQFSTTLPIGSFSISATYTGDEYYLESTDTTSLNVVQATTTVTISGVQNPAPQNHSITVTASVGPGPTGTLTIHEGSTVFGTITAPVGRITIAANAFSVGTHTITADYSGDANYLASTGSYSQVIGKPLPFLGLSFTPSNPMVAGPATIHATLSGGTETGTVSFYDNSGFIGTATVTNGAGDLQTSFTWGSHVITASYSGDSTWAAANSQVYGFTAYIGSWGVTPAVRAVGRSGPGMSVSWSLIIGAASYTLYYRQSVIDGWHLYATYTSSTSGISGAMPVNATLEFAVTATDSNGNVSAMSAPDLATPVTFTDSTLTPGITPVKAVHMTELRTAINFVRAFAGFGAFSYSTTPSTGQPISTTDIIEMRTSLSQARNAIGMPISFTDPSLTSTSPIRVVHILELRAGTD